MATIQDADDAVDGASRSPASGRAPRQRFTAGDGVVLLRAVRAARPWRAPTGIMNAFARIAVACAQDAAFGVRKNGPALRTRFVTLVREFRSDQCQSMRQSGTPGEFQERNALLHDIVDEMVSWDARKAQRRTASPADAREAFIREWYDEEDESEGAEGDAVVASTELSVASLREITRVVSDALAPALAARNDDRELELKRLEFKREQAELQRQHQRDEAARQREYEAEEAARRRRHELEMADRRIQADRERDERMHGFLLKVLDRVKPSS